MSPLKHSNNLAARMGRWSASHKKTAIFGWLAFIAVAFMIGNAIGTKQLDPNKAGTGESGHVDSVLRDEFKQAQVVQAENEPAAFNLVKEGKAQVYAQNRYMLLGLADNLPGARVLEDRFSAAEMSIALPKGRPAALAYVSEFVEQSKKSGTVSRAIEAAKLRGVRVAP